MVPDVLVWYSCPLTGTVSAQLCRLAVRAMTQYGLPVGALGSFRAKGYWVMAYV